MSNIFYVDVPFWTVDTIFYTKIGNNILPKFLYHFLQSCELERLNQAGGVPSLTQRVLNKLLVPVPPLEEQKRIADILDRMDALVNDLSTGLPAELEARRKQYAYYRDRLLTFPDIADTAWQNHSDNEDAVLQ